MENTTQNTQITINDLDSIRTIIDVAAQRGAFKAGELEQVGAVYNKLNAFLTDVLQQAQADQEAPSSEAEQTQGE